MQLVYLGCVFLTIVLLLTFRRPLYQAVLGGLFMTVLLFQIPPSGIWKQTMAVFKNPDSLSVLISLYFITYLQQMLEARSQIKLAQQDLNGLFHNRRINAACAPLFIGLLPSAAAMILCGDIVKESTEGYLDSREQAFVTSWFRHIPESTLPTYAGVLLMANLSGVPLPKFMAGMIIPVIVLALLGYWPYIRKLPKDPGMPRSTQRGKDAVHLFQHLWSLLLIIALILIGKMSVVTAVFLVIAGAAVIYRFRLKELFSMVRSAFEINLLLNTFLVLVLKEYISYTGVLQNLPELLSSLPIPAYLIFALLFFAGAIISGTNGIIALGTPLAFAAVSGGMPLMVLLMCMCHAASQISPTHVCLVVAADYFHITLGELIRKTLPSTMLFCGIIILYYNILLCF